MKKKQYWRSVKELNNTANVINNNTSIIDVIKNKKISRRDFLKLMGFTTASVILSACKGKVIKTIPYLTKPERFNANHAIYYASTMYDGFDLSPVLVKTKEGRPVKIKKNSFIQEPNLSHMSTRVQASLLQLYDNDRLKNPYLHDELTTWNKIDEYVIKYLNKIKNENKKIILLTPSISSPSLKNIIVNFTQTYPTTEHIIYDHVSYSKFLNASKQVLGYRGIPVFNLSQIKLLVSFDADFLSDWTPQNMTKPYTDAKKPDKDMLQHIQIESNMTITGANADIRIPHKPSYIKKILINLYNLLFGIENTFINNLVKNIYYKIIKYKNKCLIVADGDEENYIISLLINRKIQSHAIKDDKFITYKHSNDIKTEKFIQDLKTKQIGAILIYNCNPVYALYRNIKKYLKNIELRICFSIKKDETANKCNVLTPIPHWLESWGDTNPMTNIYTLIQPTIEQIFNTRQLEESLLIWMNYKDKYYYNYIKKYWEKNILPYTTKKTIFNQALFKGIVKLNKNIKKQQSIDKYTCQKKNYIYKNLELKLYPSYNIGDGNQSNNPWLQEVPDPITKITWDNCLTISNLDAQKLKLKTRENIDGSLTSDMVNIILNKKIKIKNIPIYIQPGQAPGSIGLSLGYGKKDGKISLQSGQINAYKLYIKFNTIQYNIQIQKTNQIYHLASTQTQHTMAGRDKDIAQELLLNEFLLLNDNEKPKKKEIYIWDNNIHTNNGHHFNLSIDLNSCIGCNACIIACQVENNIPVVGKNEIMKSRDMHWIRIDRYYSSEKNTLKNQHLELHPELKNPKVTFQPIMCQHCEHAPCETVCPVGATSHSEQGQNMMTYNRCIGTRYCANNCPYKVRRFNWFKYSQNKEFNFHMNNDLGRMVLNPDVVIRSRGVMEKCSLCIQMTQKTILKEKTNNSQNIKFETACAQACPTEAIKFGNIKNKKSEIHSQIKNKRKYKLLNFLGTKPNVFYLKKIRNYKTNELNNYEK
jgi:molybdopterin-containing oxidoreductase family iron-sulfur binding subunit